MGDATDNRLTVDDIAFVMSSMSEREAAWDIYGPKAKDRRRAVDAQIATSRAIRAKLRAMLATAAKEAP